MISVPLARGVCSAAGVLIFAAAAVAQPPAPAVSTKQKSQTAPTLTLTGQVRRAGTLQPIPKALVIVEGTKLEAAADQEGRFTLTGIPPGSNHVIISAPGFVPLRAELVIKDGQVAPLDALLDTEVHYTEVISVSPDARDQIASYQPTSVLAGQDLNRELETTIGATLARQPGVAERSLGPGPSRPVIRGLDGDRVLILEDGQRTGDLSSQSGDHGVQVNPASASRIEVVRGPATLLYGANAIGGLVNVITEAIPTRPVDGVQGNAVMDLGTASKAFVGAAEVTAGNRRWALRAGGNAQRNGDVTTPEGELENTQSRAASGNVGLSWTGTNAYIGATYGYDDSRYGIPVIEEGQVELTPHRHLFAVKAERSGRLGPVAGFRVDFASRRFQQEEIVAGEAGTRFENDTDELNVLVKVQPVGRLTGSIGAWFLDRRFLAEGEEALAPPVKERGAAVFAYEELTWPHVTFQFGGRVNRASYEPSAGLPAREFTDTSASAGLLFRPAATGDKLTMAVSVARAVRHPALEELYFFGPHHGNFAFEIGNPDLKSERALGIDLSLRWRSTRASGEVTYFRNSIDDYVFRNPITEEEFDRRFGHAAHADEGDGHEEFPFIEFTAADSLLQGIEAHSDVELFGGLGVELGFDYVRGELRASAAPLPRIPPLRLRAGVHYRRNALQAGGEITAIAKQDRVFGAETPTAGYNLVKLFASYSFGRDRRVNTITARLDNVTNELYRNHLSLIKDLVAEMGRNVKLIYSVRF